MSKEIIMNKNKFGWLLEQKIFLLARIIIEDTQTVRMINVEDIKSENSNDDLIDICCVNIRYIIGVEIIIDDAISHILVFEISGSRSIERYISSSFSIY